MGAQNSQPQGPTEEEKATEQRRKSEVETKRRHEELQRVTLDVESSACNGTERKVKVIISNQGKGILEGSRLWLMAEPYWIKTSIAVILEPYETKEFFLVAKKSSNASLEKLSPNYEIRLISPDGGVLCEKSLPEQLWSYGVTAKLAEYRLGAIPLNIYVVGTAGASKSSWINTCYTVVSEGTAILQPVVVGGTASHVTTQIKYFCFPSTSLRLVDTWGIGTDTFTGQHDVKHLIEGQYPEGYDMKEGKLDRGDVVERRAHAVIFMIACGEEKDEGFMVFIRKAMEQVKAAGLNPIIVAGLADQVAPSIRINPLQEDGKFEETRRRMAATLSVPLAHIFPCVPYVEEAERRPEIDILNYKILKQAAHFAIQFLLLGDHMERSVAHYKKLTRSDSDDVTKDLVTSAFQAIGVPVPKEYEK